MEIGLQSLKARWESSWNELLGKAKAAKDKLD